MSYLDYSQSDRFGEFWVPYRLNHTFTTPVATRLSRLVFA